jgi:hypothetical protein
VRLLVLLGWGFANLVFLHFGSQSLLWLLTGASEKTCGFLGMKRELLFFLWRFLALDD